MAKSYMKLDGNLIPISLSTVGTTSKEEETKTVTPNFASGNQIILPTTNKVLSQVTLIKPTDLIPENIAKDKNVCGVVGTLEGGGGSMNKLTVIFEEGSSSNDIALFYSPMSIYDGDNNLLLSINDSISVGSDATTFVYLIPTNTFVEDIQGGSAGTQIVTTGLTYLGNRTYSFDSNEATIKFYAMGCYLKDTPITLSNNFYKLAQDITYEDDLLVWDFDSRVFASAKPLWIQKKKTALKYNHLVFSDGSIFNSVNQHRIFNVEKGMFTYPMTDDTPLGTTTFNDKGEFITLVSKEVIEEVVEYYNIITDYHMNLFTGTILTSCRLSNLYPIVDMQYVKDNRELHNPEIFNELDDKWVSGLRLLEQPLDINRDNAVVFENSLVEYVKRSERSMKDDK